MKTRRRTKPNQKILLLSLSSMEESLVKKHEQERVTWGVYSEEMRRICEIAGPMVAVVSSQYLLQVVSTMIVGHLGELYLSSAALAISLSGVTGFSLLVSSYLLSTTFFFISSKVAPYIANLFDFLITIRF